MKLAYVHYLMPGDTAMHHVNQFESSARELVDEIRTFAMNLALPESGDGADDASEAAGEVKRRPFARYLHEPKELLWNARYVPRELRRLREFEPDVLLVRDHPLTASCVPVARRLKIPLVLEVNAPAVESRLYFDEYWHLPLLPERIERYKLRRAAKITVVSSALRNYLVDLYKLPPSKFTVVPNGADLEKFNPKVEPDSEVLEKLDAAAGSNTVVVGTIGSFQKFHGSDLFCEMINRVGQMRENVCFLLVGDGPTLDELLEKTSDLGNRVISQGRVPHERVPGHVACLDVGVLVESAFYCSPLKVLEWMASARAIVAPGYEPLGEIIEDGVQGLLFPPRDVDALVQSVLRAVDDLALRKSLGSSAFDRARSSLTWKHNAERVISTCQQAKSDLERLA